MDSDTIKLIGSFVIFFLGVISTILFKRFDKRKEQFNKSLDEVRELVNIWYNQLHEIYLELVLSPTNVQPPKYMFYINNRLVLPKLIHHLEILRNYNKAEKIVKLVESFLSLVTNFNKSCDLQAQFIKDSSNTLSNTQSEKKDVNTEWLNELKVNLQSPEGRLSVIVGHENPELKEFIDEKSNFDKKEVIELNFLSCNPVFQNSSTDFELNKNKILLNKLDEILQKLSLGIADLKK